MIPHDLYAEGFDPVLRADETYTAGDEATELLARGRRPGLVQERPGPPLEQASVLAVVHPNWWGKPPAMVAGWMDRVLVPDVAYELTEGRRGAHAASDLAVLVVKTADRPRPGGRAVRRPPRRHLGALRPALRGGSSRPFASTSLRSTPCRRAQRAEAIDHVRALTTRLVQDPARLADDLS